MTKLIQFNVRNHVINTDKRDIKIMKKLSIVLFAVLLSVSTALAQNAVGDWMIHTTFVGSSVKNVVESRHWETWSD